MPLKYFSLIIFVVVVGADAVVVPFLLESLNVVVRSRGRLNEAYELCHAIYMELNDRTNALLANREFSDVFIHQLTTVLRFSSAF